MTPIEAEAVELLIRYVIGLGATLGEPRGYHLHYPAPRTVDARAAAVVLAEAASATHAAYRSLPYAVQAYWHTELGEPLGGVRGAPVGGKGGAG